MNILQRSGRKCVVEAKNHKLIKIINDRESTWPAQSVILLRGNDDADNLDLYIHGSPDRHATEGGNVPAIIKTWREVYYIYIYTVACSTASQKGV
jgi:hypothetical protein